MSPIGQTLGDSEECCSPWGHKELDMTQNLDNECLPLLLYYCQLLIKWLLVFALCIEVLCWMHIYLQLIYFLLGSLDHYVMSFCFSQNSLHFKVYFIFYGYCYSNFLQISIYMEFLFPSPYFLSVCIPRSEVCLLYTAYIQVLFQYSFSQSLSFGWRI